MKKIDYLVLALSIPLIIICAIYSFIFRFFDYKVDIYVKRK